MSITYKGVIYFINQESPKFDTPNEATSKLWLTAKLNDKLSQSQINMIYNMKKYGCKYGKEFNELLEEKNLI